MVTLEKETDENNKVIWNEDGWQEKFISFEKRLNRERFFFRIMLLDVISFVLGKLFDTSKPDCLLAMIIIMGMVVLISWNMLSVRRCHDIGWSGWWCLLLFIPLINTIFMMILLFKKGTHGDNKYGPDPLMVET